MTRFVIWRGWRRGFDLFADKIESSVINVTLVMDYAANDEYLDENGEYDQPDLMQDDDNYASQTDEDDDDEDDFDRDALPAFANAENRGLNKQLQEQEQKSEALQRLVTENHDRVKIMDEHLKNVKQELTHTQRLVSAKAAEYKTEEHLQRLAENEVSGILLSIRKAEANQEETVDRLNVCQNNIFKGRMWMLSLRRRIYRRRTRRRQTTTMKKWSGGGGGR